MFSGIIKELGQIIARRVIDDSSEVLIVSAQSFKLDVPSIGDSIAVNGVCLTATSCSAGEVSFDISSETLRKTTLGQLKQGSEVNLERSLAFGDAVHGHLVQGHIDEVAEVLSIDEQGDTWKIGVSLPDSLKALVVEKGSICVDGVSLTLGDVKDDRFFVYVIPHTRSVTVIKGYGPGVRVNIEADCLARYVSRAVEVYS